MRGGVQPEGQAIRQAGPALFQHTPGFAEGLARGGAFDVGREHFERFPDQAVQLGWGGRRYI
jgi:hypothetical protein